MDEKLKGPDLLEHCATRAAAGGFHMDAEMLKTLALQWRTERGEFAPPASKPMAPAKSIRCAVVGADYGKKHITVEGFGHFTMPFGDCWLVPLEPIE